MSSSLSPATPLTGPGLPLTPLQQPAVEVVASSAEPAAAGMFLLGLGMVLKSIKVFIQLFQLFFFQPLPSLIEKHVGSLGDDGLLVSLGDAAVIKVVPVTIGLVLPVSSVYNNTMNEELIS